MPSTLDIFCCYAREDKELLQRLTRHLVPLQRQGLITINSDIDINAGNEWEKEIDQHLNAAQIILLLISPDFMASEYCYSKEMQRAMQRHDKDEAHVIPILLRPTHWQGAPFGKLQMLPNGAVAVKDRSWYTEDEALYDVTERISTIVNELTIRYALKDAKVFYDEQRYEGALVIYDQLINREPNLAEAYLGKGQVLFVLQRYEECLVVYEKAFNIDAKIADVRFYRNKAYTLNQLQRFEESLIAYDDAIRRTPLSIELYIEKVNVLLQVKRYQEAFEMYSQIIRLRPTKADYYIQAGDLLLKLERYEQALDQYGHAIELKPEEVIYYGKKGEILLHLKRFEEALNIYDKVLDVINKQPDFVEPFVSYYDKKGQTLLELNRYREALATYEQCIQDYGAKDPYYYYRKGKSLFGLERYGEALITYDETIRLSGANAQPEFYQAKGETHERLAQQAYKMAERLLSQPEKGKREEIAGKHDYIDDTIIVPAREEGFQNVFLKEDRWFAVRINSNMRPKIKYIAAYQVAPQSAITYIAPVRSIEPWEGDTSKFVVNFSEPAKKIGPIPLLKDGNVKAPQNLRYTNFECLLHAKTLDDIWDKNGIK